MPTIVRLKHTHTHTHDCSVWSTSWVRGRGALCCVWSLALMAAWVMTAATPVSADPPKYRIIDLGHVNPPIRESGFLAESIAYGISDRGEITGETFTNVGSDPVTGPFRWRGYVWLPRPNYNRPTKMSLLATSIQGHSQYHMAGRGINVNGFVVGTNNSLSEAWIWNLDSNTDQGLNATLGATLSRGEGINDLSPPQISGWMMTSSTFLHRGYRLTLSGSPTVDVLAPTFGSGTAEAWRIGNSGLVAGESVSGNPLCNFTNCDAQNCQRGTYWQPSENPDALESAMEPVLFSRTVGRDANSMDQVVGTSYMTQGAFCLQHAAFWEPPSYGVEILPFLDGITQDNMTAYGISNPLDNNDAIITGRSDEANAAVLWRRTSSSPATWEIINLNDLDAGGDVILIGDEEWNRLFVAYDVNAHGWIVGEGERTLPAEDGLLAGDARRAFLLIPTTYCMADLNGDFVVDVLDLLILLGAWGPCSNPSDCPADLNGSGAVDVQDLLILLGSWGPCPGMAGSVMSLSEQLDAAGLTQQNWNDFQSVMMGEASARTKANWKCWMENYLTQCVNCPLCPGADPFAD